MPSRPLWPLVWAVCLTPLGCGPSLVSARDALAEGRLPAAAADLRSLEPGVAELTPEERARYALYRGVAELGLGNAAAADRWLFVAWRADRADPTCFDEREHGELLAAWRSMGRLPGEAGARPERSAEQTLRTAPRR